jgi:hypothetical protein
MRVKFLTIALLIIALSLTASCTKEQKEIEVYSFSGESDVVMINNGLIISTEGFEKFIGGDLTFKGEEPLNVKYCVTKFFFDKDGVESTILNNSESNEGTTKGTKISPDMGSISSEKLFYGNDLEQINKSLNLSISGLFMSGEKFEYNVALDVEKAY